MPGWTEKMEIVYGKVFVTCPNSNYVFVLDAQTNKLTDSVWVGQGAGSMVLDKNDRLWVLASGDLNKKTTARLSRINAVTLQSEKFFDFAPQQSPASLCENKTKDTLYYANGSIFKMPIDAVQLPSMAWINFSQKTIYGLACSPTDYNLYASDALDYVQRSTIYVYSPYGTEIRTFKAGINTNSFYFD